LVVAIVSFLQGCALTDHFAYTNTKLTETAPTWSQASFEIKEGRTKLHGNVLVLLALSGGGSRAAYFSARAMFALERVPGPEGTTVNVLREVDLISSVSGGSLAAAYYVSSFDPDDPSMPVGRRIWNERTVTDLLGRNYIARWVGNWFWPMNVAKFWLTAYDRTDIMAQTFADNLFDSTATGIDLRLRDLNPARPNLVLNATIGSRSYGDLDPPSAKMFGTVFTFTLEDFATRLNSDITDYEIARAVMASATFPAAFNYMTLADLHDPPNCPNHGGVCYVHIFDGGNSDNLGLLSIKRVLLSNHGKMIREYDRIVVVFVDAYRRSLGADPSSANPRGAFSYVVDTNFLDATDSLLEGNRLQITEEFFARNIASYQRAEDCRRENLPDHACVATWGPGERIEADTQLRAKLFFFQVGFDAVPDSKATVREKLHSIPTTFEFADGEMEAIEIGVASIFGDKDGCAYPCVQRLGEILVAPRVTRPIVDDNPWCGGGTQADKEERHEIREKVR
jgi:NTE family protein